MVTLGASVLSVFAPQIGGIAAGFAIIWALAWRRQEAAVAAIEERDGAASTSTRTSPLKAIRLIRTPGFGGDFLRLGRLSAATAASETNMTARGFHVLKDARRPDRRGVPPSTPRE